jgi:protein-S-isoprenylcysteine O-methyltransferase Ste14
MNSTSLMIIVIVLLIVVIVGVDFLFFKNFFLERLIANVGIVLIFMAFALRFMKH